MTMNEHVVLKKNFKQSQIYKKINLEDILNLFKTIKQDLILLNNFDHI